MRIKTLKKEERKGGLNRGRDGGREEAIFKRRFKGRGIKKDNSRNSKQQERTQEETELCWHHTESQDTEKQVHLCLPQTSNGDGILLQELWQRTNSGTRESSGAGHWPEYPMV